MTYQESPLQRKPRDDEIDVFGLTHPGRVRARNDDHFLIAAVARELRVLQTSLPQPPVLVVPELSAEDRTAFIAVVADGVGGSRHGDEASRLAVEDVTTRIVRALSSARGAQPDDDAELMRALAAAAEQTHAEMLRRSRDDPSRAGMATTLTLYLGLWPRVYVLQVGDSRYYLLRGGVLTQVTRDQTIAQQLVDDGVLTRVQAAGTPWAHVLSSAIGGPASSPSITRILNERSNVHLMCSDGLTRHVSDDRIRERLSTISSARQVCEDLLREALDAGGKDNITIVVGRVIERGDAGRS